MRWLTWSHFDQFQDLGMLVVRAGLGVMIMMHGWPKLAGGAPKWERLGHAMSAVGVDAFPLFWGAAAAFTEFFGGFLILVGFATRPVAALIVFILFVAALRDLTGSGWDLLAASHPIETGLAFMAVLFAGPGRYSIDHRLSKS